MQSPEYLFRSQFSTQIHIPVQNPMSQLFGIVLQLFVFLFKRIPGIIPAIPAQFTEGSLHKSKFFFIRKMHSLRPDVSVTRNTLQGKNIIIEIGQPHAGMTQKCVQIRAIGTHVESDHRTAAIEKCNLGIHGRDKVVPELSVIVDTAAFVSLAN